MADEPAPRRRIPLWGLITGTIVLSLFLAVGGFLVWFKSDADLRAADAAARAAGLPATWSELGLVADPPETQTALKRLDALAKLLKPWRDGPSGSGPARVIVVGQPPPEGLFAHHDALPAATLTELLRLLDGLGDVAPIWRTSTTFATLLPEITAMKTVCRLLAERVVLASPEECPREARRLLHAVKLLGGPEAVIIHLVWVSLASIASEAIAYRLPDLRLHDAALAADVRALAARLEEGQRRCHLYEMLTVRESLQDPAMLAAATGPGVPSFWWPVLQRAGRAAALGEQVEWIGAMSTVADGRDLIALAQAHEARMAARRSVFKPGSIMTSMLVPARLLIVRKTVTAAMRLRLLAAELEGSSWPEDECAAPGTKLGRGEREGVLMYGYSVGKDGIDDGGDKKKDDCFPLYGPVELPKSALGTP